jgi:hypothetical protein
MESPFTEHGKAKEQLSHKSIRQQVMHITHSADYYGVLLIPYIILYSTHKIWKIQVTAPTTKK